MIAQSPLKGKPGVQSPVVVYEEREFASAQVVIAVAELDSAALGPPQEKIGKIVTRAWDRPISHIQAGGHSGEGLCTISFGIAQVIPSIPTHLAPESKEMAAPHPLQTVTDGVSLTRIQRRSSIV